MKLTVIVPILAFSWLAPFFIHYYYKRKIRRLQQKKELCENKKYYYHTIFIDYKNFNCKPHIINKEECGEHCSYTHLNTIIKFISSAKYSISMCIYMITYTEIGKILLDAKHRGVKVRVITDKQMAKAGPSRIKFFEKVGIPCKVQPSEDSMMHHKFCLIDEKDEHNAKAFFGTVNLTHQGFCKNFDNVILTNDRNIVQRLSEQFEELWHNFV